MKDFQWLWGKCVNGGQVAEESRRGPKCEAKFMIFDQSSELSRFLPHTGQIVTILASHWSKIVNMRILLIPDNNNPMQRICEEKARRKVDWAFMKDCQWMWGKCVNGRPTDCGVPWRPDMWRKFTIFDQSSKFSLFIVTLVKNCKFENTTYPR